MNKLLKNLGVDVKHYVWSDFSSSLPRILPPRHSLLKTQARKLFSEAKSRNVFRSQLNSFLISTQRIAAKTHCILPQKKFKIKLQIFMFWRCKEYILLKKIGSPADAIDRRSLLVTFGQHHAWQDCRSVFSGIQLKKAEIFFSGLVLFFQRLIRNILASFS